MWGMSSRSERLGGDNRRARRVYDSGLMRATLRGPVERTVLDIEGELDFTSAEELIVAVRAIEQPVKLIELQGLDFVDAAGARALRHAAELLEAAQQTDISIVGAQPHVERVLQLVDAYELTLA